MTAEHPELFPGQPISGGMLVPTERSLPPVPLEHTAVRATIIGPVCDVQLTQRFHNTHTRPVEAVYIFPLPEDAAVTELTVLLGERLIQGQLHEREQARQTYEQARGAGQGAALLGQERPNIFSLSLANIQPGERVEVALRFHDRLVYDDGGYTFVFPTVVLPRYTPTAADAPPSAPLLPADSRDGHSISLRVELDAGALDAISSPSHAIDVEQQRAGRAVVTLREAQSIPNKDFVLRYRVGSGAAHQLGQAAAFTVRPEGHPGTLLLTVVPQLDAPPEAVMPRELLFVFDRSGSMGGASIVQARNALRACLRALNPDDLFNIFPFDHAVEQFSPQSQPFTQASIDAADAYIASIEARGGTEILGALQAALRQPADRERLRVVVFLTDGAVGNEDAVLRALAQSLGAARVFAFGIGSAVNRFLLDKLAELGRGSVEYIFPGEGIEEAVQRFQSRAAFPLLRDLTLDWGGAQVADVYPPQLPDLYAGQPLDVLARFFNHGRSTVTLRGRSAAGAFEQALEVEWPAATPERAAAWQALPQVWARARIDALLAEQRADGQRSSALRDQVLALALEYRLLSPYTSFVAVEERRAEHARRPAAELVVVPIHLPEGTNRGAFESQVPPAPMVMAAAMPLGGMARRSGLLDAVEERVRGITGFARPAASSADAATALPASPQPKLAPPSADAPQQRSLRQRAEAALRYLARTQSVDGSWAASEVATALALLAFLKSGQSDRAGIYRPQLTRAVAWLIARKPAPVVAWALAALAAATGTRAHRSAAEKALAGLAAPSDDLARACIALAQQALGQAAAPPSSAGSGVPHDERSALALALAAATGALDDATRGALEALQAEGDDDGALVPAGSNSKHYSSARFAATAAAAFAWL